VRSPDELALISDLYRAIASVTTRFEFTEPVEDADLRSFADHLVEATLDFDRVRVRVERDANPRFVLVELDSSAGGYRRQMIIGRSPA
jgi:hypothetical protein